MKTYLMYPDPCTVDQEPAAYEVWAREGNVYELLEFLQNDSPEVFAAAYSL